MAPSRPMLPILLLVIPALLLSGGVLTLTFGTPVFPFLAAGFAAGLAAYVLYARTVQRPSAALDAAETQLLANELTRLNLSIAELAQGNLAIRMPVSDGTLRLPRSTALGSLIERFDEYRETIREAIESFNEITQDACSRMFYVGADSFKEGKTCGEKLYSMLGGAGTVLIIQGSLISSSQNLRVKGFRAALLERHTDIRIVGLKEDAENPENTRNIVVKALEDHPELNAVYIAHGSTSAAAAEALERAGKAGVVKLVVHDLTPDTIRCLEKGTVSSALSQNAFAQGHDPLIRLYNYLVTGERPVITRLLTPLESVTPENLRHYWNEKDGLLVSEKALKSLAKPADNPERKNLTIGVILPHNEGFWEQVYAGVLRAKEQLSARSIEVLIEFSGTGKALDWRAETFIPIIRLLIERGCRAVAVPLFDAGLVPFINEISAQGIAVATFNAEPSGLRGMMGTIRSHAAHLCKESDNLAAGATESSQAAEQISATMQMILLSTHGQLEQLETTNKLLSGLVEAIGRIRTGTESNAETARKTRTTASAGFEEMRSTRERMDVLNEISKKTRSSIELLNNDVLKIEKMAHSIDDIASRTNVLAINTGIQAANSGELGKSFTVIARDIRNLAEQSKHATDVINTLVKSILTRMTDATSQILETIRNVELCADAVNRTAEAFSGIMDASSENERKTGEIAHQALEMNEMSEHVKTAMTELIRLNENNSAAVEEISAAVQQMNNQVNEISRSAQLFSEMGRSQEDLLAQFTTETADRSE